VSLLIQKTEVLGITSARQLPYRGLNDRLIMPDIVIAVLIGCALGFGIGYAVRERVSRERHRRHRRRDIY
jgi:hypothetical protein